MLRGKNDASLNVFIDVVKKITLLINFAPNHAVSAPKGGGITLTPLDREGLRSSWSSFSNLSVKTAQT